MDFKESYVEEHDYEKCLKCNAPLINQKENYCICVDGYTNVFCFEEEIGIFIVSCKKCWAEYEDQYNAWYENCFL